MNGFVSGQSAAGSNHASEPLLFEQVTNRITYNSDGSATKERYVRVRVQSSAGIQEVSVLTFPYAASNDDVQIKKVRVIHPDGSSVDTAPSDAQDIEAAVTRFAPLYSDLREKQIAVRGLRAGDVLESEVVIRQLRSPIPGQFWTEHRFIHDAIVQSEDFELSVPAFKYVQVKSRTVQPQISLQGNQKTYHWHTANLRLAKADEDEDYAWPLDPSDIQVTTFRSWNEVGQWYAQLQRERIVPDASVKAKAAAITSTEKTPEGRLRASYEFVSSQIRYVGLDFGIGRFQPHFAHEVLSNGYGDCKDKHTLLASLLAAEGIASYAAPVNAISKIDPDVPSPGQFDHVLTAIPNSSGFLWLDTTMEVAPLGLIQRNIRGQYALVIPSEGLAHLVKIAADPPFPTFDHYSMDGSLEADGTLHGNIKRELRGDEEWALRLRLRSSPQDEWKKVIQSLPSDSWFTSDGEIENLSISPPESTETPLEIKYSFRRKDYSDESFSPPLPTISFPESDRESPTLYPITLDLPHELDYSVRLVLPQGANPQLPTPVEADSEFFDYVSKYSSHDNTFMAERRLVTKTAEVPASKFSSYKRIASKITDEGQVEVKGTGVRTAGSSNPSLNPDAVRLFNEAHDAFTRSDWATVIEYCREVLQIDPKYPDAQALLGSAQALSGHFEEGVETIHKELDEHPDSRNAYHMLAYLYTRRKMQPEAIDAWQHLVHLDPKDTEAAVSLGNALIAAKRYADALSVLKMATQTNPDSARLQLGLASAEFTNNNTSAGLTAADKALHLDGSALVMNDVAYMFAEHNIQLDDAAQYASRAVQAAESETAAIDLDKVQASDFSKVRDLYQNWDTLGWVAFRRGDLNTAERYLRSAWNLSQQTQIGEHLAKVLEAEGKVAASRDTHELALAASFPGLRGDAHAPLRAGELKAARQSPSPGEELSRLRTFKITGLPQQNGTAEFLLLFQNGGGLKQVKLASGPSQFRSVTAAMQRVDFRVEFPDKNPTRILRRAILSCGAIVHRCDVVLLTPDVVHSAN